jgi:tetratricopeptide (TPR) repeat protein
MAHSPPSLLYLALLYCTGVFRRQPAMNMPLASRSDGQIVTDEAPQTVRWLNRRYRRWGEAVEMLRLAERDNHDVWGTPPEYWYTLAWCLKQKGEDGAQYLAKARASAGRVDRFPYREESEAPLAAAVEADPKDAVARFRLACLLYHRGRAAEAIRQWEAAIETAPADFASRRALGMAYAEQGYAVEKAAAQLEEALKIQPSHIPTFNDLSTLYARAGRFEEQLALLQRALARSPGDDTIAEGILAANVISGRYGEAEKLIASHQFAPRHRTYGLRDKYRFLRYEMAGAAFRKGDYSAAQKWLESASKPPVSLGIDDF